VTRPPHYGLRRARGAPPLDAKWDAHEWTHADTLAISHFRPEGSDHRPSTRARLLYDAAALHGVFRVEDRYVRCVHTAHSDPVCRDSAVEFFVQPKPDRGYFNFEFNCGGALLAYHISDHRRVGDAFAAYTPPTPAEGALVLRCGSLPPIVTPEESEPLVWTLQFRIPLALIERYVGSVGALPGQCWRGNWYKCGDETSHPHWAAWSPVDELNFHLPRCFGKILFEEPTL
jgi:hypothetical protein